MSGKTCLVTGATSGIGRAAAGRLAELGADLVVVARDPARGGAAAGEIRRRAEGARVDVLVADLARPDAVRALAAEVGDRYDRLDVLVSNAGVIKYRREATPDGFEATFATNHLGPFLLVNLLRGLLERSAPARVVVVASGVHRQVREIPWDDLAEGRRFDRMSAYAVSKLLNILFTGELARRLAGTGVTANSVHPGFVRTDLGRDVTGAFGQLLKLVRPFQASPERGAATVVHLASSPDVAEVSGGYFANRRQAEPSALARDRAAAERLWALSARLCGLDGA
jgi:NAD(P)-dependent dehydrogenase (short-subunit alcohol dehydrogenase family)